MYSLNCNFDWRFIAWVFLIARCSLLFFFFLLGSVSFLQFLKLSAADYIKSFDPSVHVSDPSTTFWWSWSKNHVKHLMVLLWSSHVTFEDACSCILHWWNYLHYQDFPQIDILKNQYYNASHSESYSCLFKDVAVKNVVTDPDIPSSCKTSSSEYVFIGNVNWVS